MFMPKRTRNSSSKTEGGRKPSHIHSGSVSKYKFSNEGKGGRNRKHQLIEIICFHTGLELVLYRGATNFLCTLYLGQHLKPNYFL